MQLLAAHGYTPACRRAVPLPCFVNFAYPSGTKYLAGAWPRFSMTWTRRSMTLDTRGGVVSTPGNGDRKPYFVSLK
ncbi:MAG: hypothetical protein ACKV2V_07490 [Blastocatellia bacterium]